MCFLCYLSVVLLLYHCHRVETHLQLNDNNNNNNSNNSIQFFIIYVPCQQPQGQLQTQHSVDKSNYIMDKQHIVKDR
jgi:hypothetical protein